MESFAFWYTRNKNTKNFNNKTLSATLNFNLWLECEWKTIDKKPEVPFLDIGFKIKNLANARTLHFFVPFEISDDEKNQIIEDLGCKFNKTELVDAVFNESYRTTIASNSKCIYVENIQDENDSFNIYQLDVQHDITIENFSNGTIISIDTIHIINTALQNNPNSGANNPDYYLRFRIKTNRLFCFIHKYTPPKAYFLQSMFDVTYMIDFRYHNIRSLDKNLIEKFSEKENSIVPVNKLHFLLITKAYVNVEMNDDHSIRKLEDNVWKSYVNENNEEIYTTEDFLAYHCMKKGNISAEGDPLPSSFELFAKVKTATSLLKHYFMLTLIVGAGGSLLATAFCKIFCSLYKLITPFLLR